MAWSIARRRLGRLFSRAIATRAVAASRRGAAPPFARAGGGARAPAAPRGGAALAPRGFAAETTPREEEEESAPGQDASSAADSGSGSGSGSGSESERDRRVRDKDEAHVLTQKILAAAMKRVPTLGWTDDALRAAARDLNLSPAAARQVPRGVGALVDKFVSECDSRLALMITTKRDEELRYESARTKLEKIINWRLDMIKPVIDDWAAALAVQARPENLASTVAQRAMLANDMCDAIGSGFGLGTIDHHLSLGAVGDAATRGGWYGDRAVVGALYAAAEAHLLADASPGYEDTRAFVHEAVTRLDAFGTDFEEASGYAGAAMVGWDWHLLRAFGIRGGREGLKDALGGVAGALAKAAAAAAAAGTSRGRGGSTPGSVDREEEEKEEASRFTSEKDDEEKEEEDAKRYKD